MKMYNTVNAVHCVGFLFNKNKIKATVIKIVVLSLTVVKHKSDNIIKHIQ